MVVPLEQIFSLLKGGAVEARARTGFVDETMRITRVGDRDDQIFVYVREPTA